MQKTDLKINLLGIAAIAIVFTLAALFFATSKIDASDLYAGVSGILVLIVTAILFSGNTDKTVPLSTYNALIARPTTDEGNPLRLNILGAYLALCAIGIIFLAFTDVNALLITGTTYALGIVATKKLSDPDATDKTVPEEVVIAEIKRQRSVRNKHEG